MEDLEILDQRYSSFKPYVKHLTEKCFYVMHVARPDVVEWLMETNHVNFRSYNGSFLTVGFKNKQGAMEFKLRFM